MPLFLPSSIIIQAVTVIVTVCMMDFLSDGVVHIIQPHLLGQVVTRLKQDIPKSISVSPNLIPVRISVLV